MRIIDYLYKRYECDDIETLKCRCPLNIDKLNLNERVYENFVLMLNTIEEIEDEEIAKILDDRGL